MREASAGMAAQKVDVVTAVAPRRKRMWPAVVAGAVGASLVVGSLMWFVGNVQGRDEVTAAANARIADAQAQAASVQQQLQEAVASAEAAPIPEPSVQASATPESSAPTESSAPQVPGPALLAVGDEGLFALAYVVRPGDNLWDLSRKYLGDGNEFRRLLKANPELRQSGLEPGQTIKVLVRGTLQSTGRE